MVIAALAAFAAGLAGVAADPCANLLSRAVPRPPASAIARVVGADDLLRLRDFGPFGAGLGGEAFLALSPDERHVAFQLRRADPATNSHCMALAVVDLATGHAQLVDAGGELIRPTYVHDGLAGFPMGIPATIAPNWSPNGRWIATLKRVGGITQAWRVRADGSGSEQVTHEAQDVTAVTWSADGQRLIFQTDRLLHAAQVTIDAEGARGWRYDERVLPMASARPFPPASDPVDQVFALDIKTGRIGAASRPDRDRLSASRTASRTTVVGTDGQRVTLTSLADDPAAYQSHQLLRVQRGEHAYSCRAAACSKARAYWLAPDGRSVLLLARSGWGDGDETIYRWTLRSQRVAKLFTTPGLLLGCQPVGPRLLCARESSTTPRRLVVLDPRSGRSTTLFNPNPEYDRLRVGRVERLPLVAANGTRTFADVMLPPDFAAGHRYPMVVVQYESRGFLRGGTGDEYPIPALASAGMIVLSFQRTLDVAATAVPPPVSDDDFNRLDFAHWADRRNVNSALVQGVETMVARGSVDPKRIGITGLSDGVGTAAYALLNSHLFSVAALSGCCEEPVGDLILQGPTFSRMMEAAGYPTLSHPDAAFWAPYSVEQNAARLTTPLLIQAPDREFLFSLPTVQALRERGAPVDLYVFPGEFHVKLQPAHKAAVYERTLRWFEFWFDLPPMPGQQPQPADEIARWRAMQSSRTAEQMVPVPLSNAGAPMPPHR